MHIHWPAGERQEDTAEYLISRGADVNAVDEKNVSACLIASATGTSCTSPPSLHACMLKARPALCACSRCGYCFS